MLDSGMDRRSLLQGFIAAPFIKPLAALAPPVATFTQLPDPTLTALAALCWNVPSYVRWNADGSWTMVGTTE